MKLRQRTKAVEEMFKKIRNKRWTPEVIMVDLMEEVGELANAVLTEEKFKSMKRRKAGLKDSIADVLLDIVFLANHYKIDIESEYEKVLKQIEDRIKNGDFDD